MNFSMNLTCDEHNRLVEAAGDLTLTAFVRKQVLGDEYAGRVSRRRGLGKNFRHDHPELRNEQTNED